MPKSKPVSAAGTMDPETWLEEHGDCLFAYAMGRVGDANTARDLVQETLLTAIERRDTFAGRSSVRTWLVGILRNKLLQHFRRVQRDRGGLEVGLAAEVVEAQFNRLGKWKTAPRSWAADPATLSQSEEFRRALRDCLAQLPPRVTEAFLLAEERQLGIENLCKVLQVSATNLYVMLYRARSALRACLEKSWFGGEAAGKH